MVLQASSKVRYSYNIKKAGESLHAERNHTLDTFAKLKVLLGFYIIG